MIQSEISKILTKKVLGLTFVLSAAAFAFAQQKVTVTSNIVDRQNNPVPYASVTFINKANTGFNDATLTDEKGFYTIQLVPGNYDVSVEAIDYKRLTTNKQISGAGSIGNIAVEREGSATLTPTQNIEGVTITAQAARPYRVELDKKIYDVSSDITSKGGNLQDVLQNVPSVSVDTDGTVSMRGNSNVRFLINGKPSSLLGIDDGANAMQAIPADQIERIEVITNPSSKFESAGTAGILNIILKKSRRVGFNGSVEGTIGYLPSTRLNTNLSWRKGSLTYYINGGGGYSEGRHTNRNNYTRLLIPASIGNGASLLSNSESINDSENKNYNVTTGINYDFTDRTSGNFSVMLRKMDNESNGNTTYFERIIQKNVNDPNYPDIPYTTLDINRNRRNFGTGDNFNYQFDGGLDHKFNDGGHLISLSTSYQNGRNLGTTEISEFASNAPTTRNNIFQETENKTFILKTDYELPVGEKSKIEAGARMDNNKNDYDYLVNRENAAGNFEILPMYTSITNYYETITAGYAQFKSKVGEKFGYQVGLRAENTLIDLGFTKYQEPKEQVDKNYTSFFPTVFVSYELAKNSQFLLNYTKRIRRPRSFFLIPFMSYNDNTNIFTGNPDLDPSFVDSFEFGYSLQKSKLTLNPTLYYKKTNDDIKMYQEEGLDTDGNTVIRTMPFNIGTEETYGLDFNATYDPFKWWKIMTNIDLFGYKTTGALGAMDYSGDGFSNRLRLTNTFRPDSKTSFQIQSFYRGGQKTANQTSKAMYAVSLGATRQIWDGNGTLSFNIQDIFNTRSREYTTQTASFTRDSYMQWQPRQFSLSLSYRFRQGEKVEQPRRKKDINSNDQGGEDGPPM